MRGLNNLGRGAGRQCSFDSKINALGWRLRTRQGDADALVTALGHTDPETRFLAAEGLALGGRSEGLDVLLASVELLESLASRRCAFFRAPASVRAPTRSRRTMSSTKR